MTTHQFPLQAIVDHFNLGQVISCSTTKGGIMNHNTIIETDSGSYFIKHVREKIETRLPLVYNIEHGMKTKGIPAIAMLANKNGEFLFSDESGTYCVYSYTSSQLPEMNKVIARKMGNLLARIHLVGRELLLELEQNHIDTESNNNLGSKEYQEKVTEELQTYKNLILEKVEKGTGDAIDDEFLEYINLKLELMHYCVWNELIDEKKVIIHGDFHNRNLLYDGDDIIAVCDWEASCDGFSSYELARTLLISKNDFPNLECVSEMYAGYNEIIPVDKQALISALQNRLSVNIASRWIEKKYYERGDDRANCFIRSDIALLTEYKEVVEKGKSILTIVGV